MLAAVPQGSILGPLLFLIYINDLLNGLESIAKLFADGTSLFSTIYDPNISADQLSFITKLEIYYCGTNIFRNCFFPYTIIEWNKLDLDVCKSKFYANFRNNLLRLGRPNQRAIYSINNPVGLKFFTRSYTS